MPIRQQQRSTKEDFSTSSTLPSLPPNQENPIESSSCCSSFANDNNNHKFYNFLRGHPNDKFIPTNEIQTIMKQLSDPSKSISIQQCLNYGESQGNNNLRSELSKFINKHTEGDDYGTLNSDSHTKNKNNDENINEFFITNGVSHGIDLLCSTQTNPNDIVYIEKPTYFLVSGIFHSHQLQIRNLPMKKVFVNIDDGDDDEEEVLEIDVDRFINDVENGIIEPPRLIYIIPTNQNPTSNTMSIMNRIKLVQFANNHNILIVADEVYHMLDWRDCARPGRFAELNNRYFQDNNNNNCCGDNSTKNKTETTSSNCVVTVSSFTKIFAPGIRCGWIEGPKEIITSLIQYGYIDSQGGCAPFVGEIMYTSLHTKISDTVLNRLVSSYKERCIMLYNSIMYNEENYFYHFADDLTIQNQQKQKQRSQRFIKVVTKPTGGYFIWVKFNGNTCMNNIYDDNDKKRSTSTMTNDIDSEDFLQYCVDNHKPIKFMPGTRCDPVSTSFRRHGITTSSSYEVENKETHKDDINDDNFMSLKPYARLCFADLDVPDLEYGATELIRCFKDYLKHID